MTEDSRKRLEIDVRREGEELATWLDSIANDYDDNDPDAVNLTRAAAFIREAYPFLASNLTIENAADVRVVNAFRPGDIVFLELAKHLSADSVDRIREQAQDIQRAVPGLFVVVLHPDVKIVSRAEPAP